MNKIVRDLAFFCCIVLRKPGGAPGWICKSRYWACVSVEVMIAAAQG